jgi:methanogenic corrinoid protein MtbC1
VLESYVEAICESGVAFDDVLLKLLAPAARRLGEMWVNDECSFVDVTVGLNHLHNVMHHLRRNAGNRPAPKRATDKRALLATAPGEQHIFGLTIVQDFLERAGWSVEGGIMTRSVGELTKLVREEPFALLGLTLSSERFVEDLKAAISQVRTVAANPNMKIFVGGQVFLNDPGLARVVGADALARDARDAVNLAEDILNESARLE